MLIYSQTSRLTYLTPSLIPIDKYTIWISNITGSLGLLPRKPAPTVCNISTTAYLNILIADATDCGLFITLFFLTRGKFSVNQVNFNFKTYPKVDQFSSVESLSHVQLSATPWISACQAFPSFIISQSLLTSSHLTLCRLLVLLPSIFPNIRVFSNELAILIRWSNYWSFSLSISPSNEYSGLISFRMDWLDLLAVHGTLKSLLQQHSSKASIFLALNFLYSPTLTSIHDHWKNHSLDQTDLCWQSHVSAF